MIAVAHGIEAEVTWQRPWSFDHDLGHEDDFLPQREIADMETLPEMG